MSKNKIEITDFRFAIVNSGRYNIYYTSPKTNTKWIKTTTDMTLIDEFKGTETSDHTQNRLNELKKLIKNN
jgi:hypothetical protein